MLRTPIAPTPRMQIDTHTHTPVTAYSQDQYVLADVMDEKTQTRQERIVLFKIENPPIVGQDMIL